MNEKKIFIARLIAFSVFSAILPFSFIAWRYELFSQITKMSLNGWGIIAIVIVFLFARYVLISLKEGQPYSMFTQIINGVLKIILPMLVLLVLVNAIKNSTEIFIQSLTCAIICEFIALPLNPFPQWIEESKKNQDEKKMDTLVSKFGAMFKKGE